MFVWIVFILIVIVGLCSSSKNDASGKGNSRNDNYQKSFEGFDDGNLPAKEDLDMLLDDPDSASFTKTSCTTKIYTTKMPTAVLRCG